MGLYSHTMKRAAIALSIVSVAAVAALAAWPLARIGSALRRGETQARTAYSDIRRQALNTLYRPDDAADPGWLAAARASWDRDDRLLALVVSHPDTGVLFALPAASHYYLEPSGPGSAPSFAMPEQAVARYSGALASGMVLDALYTTVSQRDVFIPLRDAGLAALFLTLACAALLVATRGAWRQDPLPGGHAPSRPAARPAYPVPPPPEPVVDAPPARGYGDPYADTDAPLHAPPDLDEEGLEYPSFESFDVPELPDLPAGAAPSRQGGPEPTRTSASIGTRDLPAGSLSGPQGLFDPETGLGWESYLRERLSAELKRSASFEQDLCLLLATLDDSARGSEDYAIFARTAQEFFSFKDLSFVFGERGIAVILPNMDVDHAIRMSEELLKKLTFLIKGRTAAMSYLELFMGLSSRSGRLVDADRLIGESVAALKKAREERDTHIMAFRPDPEKFRSFLASQ